MEKWYPEFGTVVHRPPSRQISALVFRGVWRGCTLVFRGVCRRRSVVFAAHNFISNQNGKYPHDLEQNLRQECGRRAAPGTGVPPGRRLFFLLAAYVAEYEIIGRGKANSGRG